ncbi:MAG: polysaccharide biosynthesis C-terminal domain-containing protein, partial [Lachnospiraceae bacterium]|nr:polysaccharide biosynthesis C-terminal domain-containing protein [Lachnospiraceae bacterium]
MQKKLFQLSVPIFVESIMGTIIGSIDTIMLSAYSDDAVAAVSIANQILFLIQVFACIVTTGTSILCAQYIGAKKTEEEQNDLITASILMNVGMGVVLTILMSLFYPVILSFLNLSVTVRVYAGEYLQVINWFLWIQLISAIFSAILRSYGKTKQSMYVSMGMNICNILLNYLLIFGKFGLPAMGIRGAAIATVVG